MDIFEVVADPVRRSILEMLVGTECSAGVIADAFPAISRPAVSRHLRVLREAGLVADEVVGRRRMYRNNPDALGTITSWIDQLRQPWTAQLDALETEVHRTRRSRERASSPASTTQKDRTA